MIGVDDKPLSSSERRVFALYSLLLKEINNIPKTTHFQCLDFRFYFYWNDEWRSKITNAYFELTKCSSITEITRF